jgi:hypothetical protein
VRIANPIYDVAFKYLLDDEKVARLMLSALLGKEVLELGFRPTEVRQPVEHPDGSEWLVLRMDFAGAEKDIRDGMDVEDDVVDAFQEQARKAAQAIEEKDRAIEAKDKALEEKDQIIADLKRRLGGLKVQVVEDAGQMLVPAYRLVENVGRCHPQGQESRIHDLQPVWMEVQEEVPALGIRPVHQGVHEKFTDDLFVEHRYQAPLQAIRKFIGFPEFGHVQPDAVHQFHGREIEVIPHPFVDLGAPIVVLDGLHDRSRTQAGTVVPLPKAKHAQVRQCGTGSQLIVIQEFIGSLFLDRRATAPSTGSPAPPLRMRAKSRIIRGFAPPQPTLLQDVGTGVGRI